MRWIWGGLAALVVVVAGIAGYGFVLKNFTVHLPTYAPPAKTVWLDQNWSADQRNWFHAADQGTRTFGIPYEWFLALERPDITLGEAGKFADPAYLDRYGFIPSGGALPVGFARGTPMTLADGSPWTNPQTGAAMAGIGLTCAACHTGRLTYKGTEILVDGGAALTNLGTFRTGLGLSVVFTWYLPGRFDRFAERVLGAGATPEARQKLQAQMKVVLAEMNTVHNLDIAVNKQSVAEGFARLDALNRIGNTVFALDMKNTANYVGYSAPVHYPRIWDVSWFDWVQYNASIMQPMVRNAGEAMGVSAAVNFFPGKLPVYASSVQVGDIFKMEQLLAGKQPDAANGFTGLRSPKWPENILPPIKTTLAAQGEALYGQLCARCHLPAVGTADFWNSPEWKTPNEAGERYLHMDAINFSVMGTDPAQATDMANRRVTVPDSLGLGTDQFGPALGKVVANVVGFYYDSQTPPVSPEDRAKMNGYRDNFIQAPLGYKARPLDGIWAAPPYLHNGSVPTLYALLSPVSERPKTVFLGGREFDPVDVGYRNEAIPEGFALNTKLRGNFNAGHEFTDDMSRPGRLDRQLAPEERRALVEYLKTL